MFSLWNFSVIIGPKCRPAFSLICIYTKLEVRNSVWVILELSFNHDRAFLIDLTLFHLAEISESLTEMRNIIYQSMAWQKESAYEHFRESKIFHSNKPDQKSYKVLGLLKLNNNHHQTIWKTRRYPTDESRVQFISAIFLWLPSTGNSCARITGEMHKQKVDSVPCQCTVMRRIQADNNATNRIWESLLDIPVMEIFY